MKRQKLYTKLLKRKVRLLGGGPHPQDAGRLGVVVQVYLLASGPWFTVQLKDGRLCEVQSEHIVVEK